MEHEKRMRREIANSNERRRMQSINAGFAGLRNLLPNHEGEKLSKAAILQQTSDYIFQLLQEKNKVVSYNNQLKRAVNQNGGDATVGTYSSPQSPAVDVPSVTKRRKTIDGALESADEGIGSMSPEHSVTSDEARAEMLELRRETLELRHALERERRHRIGLEEHIAILQQQLNAYSRKFDNERMQSSEEVESLQGTNRNAYKETARCYTIRNNLETIVEAIRHLEGDHLFSDDRINFTRSSSPPSASPRGMDISMSASASPNCSQTTVEVPLALTATLSTSCQASPMATAYSGSSGVAPGTISTPTAIIMKQQHVVTPPVSRIVEVEDQPINLEFRPGLSRSPSPFNNQTSPSSCQQQQLRPGVIVVKHS
ncbi:transcription factor AP-4 [Folsomia candida]|uniref:Transcription factor AP-4 n=1 Tax=Folsomia candida TaxID=158441 RepID=A0A226E5H2_FOLCA|nr:transcription factor AP-4 [Folsomia candida]XP_021953711.1 transcription factor AP-4 [Folsomia candida]XP_021953712.1 transcription factor AP-4 [Folsomia candida]OXA52863.1 Transcription factor AP-4 [Folsomia candida]